MISERFAGRTATATDEGALSIPRPAKNRTFVLTASAIAACTALLVPVNGALTAQSLTMPGFSESVVFSGLDTPTAVRFSPDGRIFVAEKSGIIKVFDSLSDSTATVFADLRTNVHNYWDRGLLGLALDPAFPTRPYVYVLYTFDGPIGGLAPTLGLRPARRVTGVLTLQVERRWLCRQRTCLAAAGRRQRDDRQ